MSFSAAQVFYIDAAKVNQSTSVNIDRIDLFFRSKPQATDNKSGITNPGVQVYLTTTANNVPELPTGGLSSIRKSRMEWQDIQISTDASLATTFRFDPPVSVSTGTSAAMILSYDGEEDFVPWTNVTGDVLVSTGATSTGVGTSSGVGPYFSAISNVPTQAGNNTSNSNMVQVSSAASNATMANANYIATSWTPKVGTALKFSVYVCRYTVRGDANLVNYTNGAFIANAQITTSVTTTKTANGETLFTIPQQRYEYMFYDRITSATASVAAGEMVFMQLPEYPAGSPTKVTLNCANTANTIVANGSVNFSTLLNIAPSQPNYIVIRSGNGAGPGADLYNVRQVTAILSNTQIAIDVPLTFSNSAATFWLSPVAKVDQFKRAKFFGSTVDMVICKDSTSNATVSFNPMQIYSGSIVANGTGYSNSDYVTVTGHSYVTNKYLQAWNATANVVTNGNGSITALYLSNVGSGFWNIANLSYSVSNSTGSNSAGTGANLTFTVGTQLQCAMSGGNFANIQPGSIDIGRVMPALLVSTPPETYYNASLRFPYYSLDDATVPMSRALYCDADNNWDTLSIQNKNVHYPFEFAKRRALPSWSQELFIPYANGTSSGGLGGTSNGVTGLTSNASVITYTTISNNDYTTATVIPVGTKITFSRYIINNDYTDENTNYGNSWAKGIETKFNLSSNTLAEDLLVYATVYKPANTDILVFAKLYNTQDNDAFDTKDWTMLDAVSANSVVSSPTNFNDVYEVTWALPKHPNVAFQCTGSVTTTNGSKTLTGSNTNFSNLVSGDLVLIRNNLFPNSYMVSVVNVVTNTTSMTISSPVANLNLVGSGFTVSKLAYKYQAFKNYLNDNVVRYYSSSMSENDGFNAAQIKIVMLSANGLIVPLVNDVRAVAVSA